MLRKTISVLLALAMVSALTACAGGDGSSESTPAGADPSSAASAGGASEAEDKTYGKLTISGVTGDPDAFIVAGVEKLQAEHPEIFAGVPSEGEGIRLVKKSLAYLVKTGHIWLIPGLIAQSGFKYAGYFLGKRYRKLPEKMILFCTMNREYWKKQEEK